MIRIAMEDMSGAPGFMRRDPLWRAARSWDRHRRYRVCYAYLRDVPTISAEAYATLVYCEDHDMTPPPHVIDEWHRIRDLVREASEKHRELFREGDDE